MIKMMTSQRDLPMDEEGEKGTSHIHQNFALSLVRNIKIWIYLYYYTNYQVLISDLSWMKIHYIGQYF
jgi:hypothetical protein